MNFEPGKLYRVKKYFWYLFPDKETLRAAGSRRAAQASVTWSISGAAYWSAQLKCNVGFINEHGTFMAVGTDGLCVRVVSTEGIGWICVPNEPWTGECFEQVNLRTAASP